MFLSLLLILVAEVLGSPLGAQNQFDSILPTSSPVHVSFCFLPKAIFLSCTYWFGAPANIFWKRE